MHDYTFSTLNDKEFEYLVRDLLQKETGFHLESFKSGKDRGVDLRYSSASHSSDVLIVQAKHWVRTGIASLVRHLRKSERPKVEKLSPSRYILATSLPLSWTNKEQIASALAPYIQSTADIFGCEDLNNLLGKHADVERNHYKLWISSTTALQSIVQNGLRGRSAFVQEQIQRKASLFVPTASYQNAVRILNSQRILLISGVPGVGKTSLAEFLVFQLMSNGADLVVIDDDIRDGEDLFDPSKDQVFYFDDFLGANYLELLHSKGTGSAIGRFVQRVQQDKSKRLVLTTRTTILNQAFNQLYQIGSATLKRVEFELQLGNYSRLDRAKILYNHLYFSNLPDTHKDAVFEDSNYLRIIDHKNYNPRVIEFITDINLVYDVDVSDYMDFVIGRLSNPEAIWDSAFEHQIDDYGRLLLITLFSLGNAASEPALRRAYDSRIEYEIRNGGLPRATNAFLRSIQLLLGGFVTRRQAHGVAGNYAFIDPSLVDFLISYIRRSESEKWRIMESAEFIEQFITRIGVDDRLPLRIEEHELERFLAVILEKAPSLDSAADMLVQPAVIRMLLASFPWNTVRPTIEWLVRGLDLRDISRTDAKNLFPMLAMLCEQADANTLIDEIWDQAILAILNTCYDEDDFVRVTTLFNECNLSYEEWLDKDYHRSIVQKHLDDFWVDAMAEYLSDDQDINKATDTDRLEDAIDDLQWHVKSINEAMGVSPSPAFCELEGIDLQELLDEKHDRLASRSESSARYVPEAGKNLDESATIAALFSR